MVGVPVAALWADDDQYYDSEAMLAAIPRYAADLRRLERVGPREIHDCPRPPGAFKRPSRFPV